MDAISKIEKLLKEEQLNIEEIKNYTELKKDILAALHKNDITANTSKEVLAHISDLYQLELIFP